MSSTFQVLTQQPRCHPIPEMLVELLDLLDVKFLIPLGNRLAILVL
jgi:hypothetical protein